jgi:spermidine synthase
MGLPGLFFFISGACALIYQVVWVRQITLLLGSTSASVSTVLAVFMAGLGAGAWLFGARADRSRCPLRLYAYLEIGIGLYALVLPHALSASTPAYLWLSRQGVLPLPLLRVLFGFVLLLPPAVLMGGTFPALLRHAGHRLDRLGRDLGWLYAANLAGGVAGSLLAGFALIRHLGVQGATMVAVAANLFVGVAALVWAARDITAGQASPGSAEVPREAAGPALSPRARALVWTAVFCSGFMTMAYEVLWTRMLVFGLTSTVYAFTLILATFLTGLALGSRCLTALERRHDPLRSMGVALFAAGISALLLAPFAGRTSDLILRLSVRAGDTGTIFLAGSAIAIVVVLLVPATLMGVILPLGMRMLVDDLAAAGRRVGAAYLVNTIGAVSGSLVTGFALIPALGLKGALVLLTAGQVALSWAFLLTAPGASARRRTMLLAGSTAVVVAAGAIVHATLAGPNPFDGLANTGAPPPTIVAHHDGVGASTSVVEYAVGGRVLRIDGFHAAGTAATGSAYMPMMTHVPALLHPDPRRLLVICFGTGSTAGAGLLHPDLSVDVVDINPAVFRFAGYFEAWNHGVATDARTRTIVDDGRNYLLTTSESYDVITSEPMPPRFAGMVNLYSREYYELARERLRPGGLVVQWLPLHLVSFDESLRILATVRAVFPETTLWLHQLNGIIVARHEAPIAVDLARIQGAFAPGRLREDMVRLGVPQALAFVELHALGPAAVGRATAGVAVITDDRPSLEFHDPAPLRTELRTLPLGGPDIGRETARALELFMRLRIEDRVRLANASEAESATVSRERERESRALLGRVWRAWDVPEAALPQLETAAGLDTDPRRRTAYLMEASRAAAAAGRSADAERLAAEAALLAAR